MSTKMRQTLILAFLTMALANAACTPAMFDRKNGKASVSNDPDNSGQDAADDSNDDTGDGSADDDNNLPDDFTGRLTAQRVLAYEDLYPGGGDRDYNDWVVDLTVEENYQDGELRNVVLKVIPLARAAGHDHKFIFVPDGRLNGSANAKALTQELFDGPGTATLFTVDSASNETVTDQEFSTKDDIIITCSTKQSLPAPSGTYASNGIAGTKLVKPKNYYEIFFLVGEPARDANKIASRGRINFKRYRFVLRDKNYSPFVDLDLFEVNASIGMINENGYPFGLIVPHDWSWPLDQVFIERVYPNFADLRAFLRGETSDSSIMNTWFDEMAADASGLYFDESLFLP